MGSQANEGEGNRTARLGQAEEAGKEHSHGEDPAVKTGAKVTRGE